MATRKKKLDEEATRNAVLALIRNGLGKHEALSECGVGVQTYRNYVKLNPWFEEQVDEAYDASVEPVLSMLREEALRGDISAAREYLKHRAPRPRSEVPDPSQTTVEHVHRLDPGDRNYLEQLRARVQQRPPLAAYDVIDVEESEQ